MPANRTIPSFSAFGGKIVMLCTEMRFEEVDTEYSNFSYPFDVIFSGGFAGNQGPRHVGVWRKSSWWSKRNDESGYSALRATLGLLERRHLCRHIGFLQD
jgi:hypothetical protein